MSVREKLMLIQGELKAPKNNYNSFGGYHYRSTEDILEALKPLLQKHKAVIVIKDAVEHVGNRYYIKAEASIIDVETGESISATAYAREDEERKKMDQAQITGSASSYARKYALNGLFAIDDTKDSDATNTHGREPNKADRGQGRAGTISTEQAKELFNVAKGDTEVVREVLNTFGFKNSTDVPLEQFESIKKVIADTYKIKNGGK